MIDVTCASCGSGLKAKEKLSGMTVACPKCKQPVAIPVIPAPEKAASIPPATERQKEYARTLGIDFAPDIDRRAMSELIDAAVMKRDDERYRRMDELQDRENAVRQQLREEIIAELDEEVPRLTKATPKQMVDEFPNRGKAAILITFDSDETLDFEDLTGVRFDIESSDNMDNDDMRAVLMAIGIIMMNRRPA
jgi:hypothetical protein